MKNSCKNLLTLQDVAPRPGAPIACVGAGTGLGECFLAAAGPDADYVAFPSEGGHAEFAPRNELELEMLAFLKDRFSEKNRISVERVVSGPGLANIYDFLRAKFPHAVCDAADARILAADAQRGALIAEAAAEGDELCSRALDILFSAYGSEVGVAALKWLPYGGLYVAGGLAPKNINRIRGETEFMAAYYDKGRLSPLLRKVPVYVVMNEDVGLRGAHLLAYRALRSMSS